MKPFDLEAFKQGAVAVDREGDDVILEKIIGNRYYCKVINDDYSYPALIDDMNEFWHMKSPSKWIVFREFDTEEEAREWHNFLIKDRSNGWKIEKRP